MCETSPELVKSTLTVRSSEKWFCPVYGGFELPTQYFKGKRCCLLKEFHQLVLINEYIYMNAK